MDSETLPPEDDKGRDASPDAAVAGAVMRGLPSEQGRPGDPRAVGFQDEPSQAHVESSATAIRAIATAITRPSRREATPLRVCFCHVRLAPRLPFNLFGFNIVAVDDEGGVRDALAPGEEVRYALVVNQPVAIQSEAALRFLFDLVERQGPLADVAAHRADFGDLPGLVASADMAAAETAWDALRLSSARAAEALTARAAAAGYALEVRYEVDPLPSRESVLQRIPALRKLYNNQEEVRDAVDRTVTMVQGRGGEIRGGTEQMRGLLQQHTTLLGVRQFFNQAIRDADVCGNGYVEFDFVGLDPLLRCLRPENVKVLGKEQFALTEGGRRRVLEQHVVHMQGLEQLESPYGISPWEPLLHLVQRDAILSNVRAFAQEAQRGRLSDNQQEQLSSLLRVVERAADDMKRTLETFLWFPRRGLPAPLADLYFNGQERM